MREGGTIGGRQIEGNLQDENNKAGVYYGQDGVGQRGREQQYQRKLILQGDDIDGFEPNFDPEASYNVDVQNDSYNKRLTQALNQIQNLRDQKQNAGKGDENLDWNSNQRGEDIDVLAAKFEASYTASPQQNIQVQQRQSLRSPYQIYINSPKTTRSSNQNINSPKTVTLSPGLPSQQRSSRTQSQTVSYNNSLSNSSNYIQLQNSSRSPTVAVLGRSMDTIHEYDSISSDHNNINDAESQSIPSPSPSRTTAGKVISTNYLRKKTAGGNGSGSSSPGKNSPNRKTKGSPNRKTQNVQNDSDSNTVLAVDKLDDYLNQNFETPKIKVLQTDSANSDSGPGPGSASSPQSRKSNSPAGGPGSSPNKTKLSPTVFNNGVSPSQQFGKGQYGQFLISSPEVNFNNNNNNESDTVTVTVNQKGSGSGVTSSGTDGNKKSPKQKRATKKIKQGGRLNIKDSTNNNLNLSKYSKVQNIKSYERESAAQNVTADRDSTDRGGSRQSLISLRSSMSSSQSGSMVSESNLRDSDMRELEYDHEQDHAVNMMMGNMKN